MPEAKGLTLIGDVENDPTFGELSNSFVLLVEHEGSCWDPDEYRKAGAIEISLNTHFSTFSIAVLSYLLYDTEGTQPDPYTAMGWIYLEETTLKALHEAGQSVSYCAAWLRNQRIFPGG